MAAHAAEQQAPPQGPSRRPPGAPRLTLLARSRLPGGHAAAKQSDLQRGMRLLLLEPA